MIGAEGGVDHRFFRTQNETRSFHHYVYSMVEEELKERTLILTVDENFEMSRWQPDLFNDGDFVEIIGLVRLMDYQWMTTMMEALPRMLGVAHNGQNVALKNLLDTQKITAQEYQARHREAVTQQKAQLDSLRNFKLGELSGLLRQLYGEAVRVKVVPSLAEPENLFVGSGDLGSFHDTAASLAQKYGFEIDAKWHTVGQVNKAEASGQLIPLPIGNTMEDSFEQVAFGLNQLVRVANAPAWPAISFTLLSIYRLIGD